MFGPGRGGEKRNLRQMGRAGRVGPVGPGPDPVRVQICHKVPEGYSGCVLGHFREAIL